jgi:DNA-binding transcriptional MerR regulator
MPEERPYTISEIAAIAGVTPRTVRYYIAQGILPAPAESGRGPHYDGSHLARLRLIRALQKRHLPLAEIRRRVVGMTDLEVTEAVGELTESDAAEPVPDTSALEYVRSIIGPSHRAAERPVALPAAALYRSDPRPASSLAREAESAAHRMPSIGREEPAGPDLAPTHTAPTSERSQWDRVALTPDIELHVRRPLSRLDNRRVERLITIARQVLKEETP